MKKLALFLGIVLTSGTCTNPPQPDPDPSDQIPYFNENNTDFNQEQIQCLRDHWSKGTYKGDTVAFRIINDQTQYDSFFSCKTSVNKQPIDFSKNSLLVGMKADSTNFPDSPVVISKVEQSLQATDSNNYKLVLKVTGRKPSSSTQGGDWFGFTSVVPKITGDVKLEVIYQFF